MAIPSGDSPQQVERYYNYLQGHQETMQSAATWHVHWVDLAWLWGFVVVLSVALVWWVRQYRSTRQRTGFRSSRTGRETCSTGPRTGREACWTGPRAEQGRSWIGRRNSSARLFTPGRTPSVLLDASRTGPRHR